MGNHVRQDLGHLHDPCGSPRTGPPGRERALTSLDDDGIARTPLTGYEQHHDQSTLARSALPLHLSCYRAECDQHQHGTEHLLNAWRREGPSTLKLGSPLCKPCRSAAKTLGVNWKDSNIVPTWLLNLRVRIAPWAMAGAIGTRTPHRSARRMLAGTAWCSRWRGPTTMPVTSRRDAADLEQEGGLGLTTSSKDVDIHWRGPC